MARRFGLVAALLIAGCGGGNTQSPPTPPISTSTPTSTPTPTPTPTSTPTPTANPSPLPFIENDYPRALAEARAKNLPLFVDTWAPWCHTCQSMRSYVFPDPQLASRAGAFVWLSIDTEVASNEAFLRQFPSKVLPTLWVIDPKTERPALRWSGSATTVELLALLDDATLAVRRADTGGEATAALLRGHKASAAGELDEAVREYRAALSAAPEGWSRRAQAVEALVTRLGETKQHKACADAADAELPKLPPGTSRANVAQQGLICAFELPRADATRARRLERFVRAVRTLAADANEPILADDRSSLFEHAVFALKSEGKTAEAKAAAAQWAAFLEAEAAKAPNPAARAVFDPHRLLAYMEIGPKAIEEKGLPMLRASARDLPDDYNPFARSARALFVLSRYDEALVAIDEALARVYGPRTLEVLSLKADILAAKRDTAGAKAVLRDALARADRLAAPERTQRVRAELTRKLEALQARR